jgi:ParB/RepB/Spo0J family partition protein
MRSTHVYREVDPRDLLIEQDRRYDQALDEAFVASIREHGVIQPLVVEPSGDGRYIVRDGRRRLRHAIAAEVGTVPVVLRGTSDDLAALIVEAEANAHRRDWSPLEIASFARELAEAHDWTQAEIAKWLSGLLERSVSRPQVSQYLKLTGLTAQAKDAVAAGTLNFTAARELCRLNDAPDAQRQLVAMVVEAEDRGRPMTAAAVKRQVERLLTPPEVVAEACEAEAEDAASRVYKTGAADPAPMPAGDLPLDGDPLEASYLSMAREALGYLVERLEDGKETDPRFSEHYKEVRRLGKELDELGNSWDNCLHRKGSPNE